MWRRIHSNRDPRDTLYSELKKEFGPRFLRTGERLKVLLGTYPKALFAIMVGLMLLSAGLSFTVFRHPEKATAAVTAKKHPDPVGEGFGRILDATQRLRQTLRLKQTVDSLAALKTLSPGDSLQLEGALDRLGQLNSTQKHQP